MFSGLVWNGKQAIELGLVDELGSLDYVAREVIKAEEVVDFTPEDNIAERVARRFGAALGGQLGIDGARWRGAVAVRACDGIEARAKASCE